MAKRLIDADDLLDTILDTAAGLADCDQQNAAWTMRKYAVRDIFYAPTVDAVEVVRCRECWWAGGELICSNPHCTKSFYGCQVPPEHFCSYGERRTEND